MRGTDPKRLSSVSPLASQPLPEDSAVDYESLDHQSHMMTGPPGSHRMSRYVAPSNTSIDSSVSDRRPSDSTTIPDTHPSQFAILQQQQQQQQQQAPQSSARSLIFRPWSKMKKIASSSQVSSDSLPPMPSHASSYSGNSN
ncbi:hypothetical protein GGI16_006277 [Coemansia sp. S142-1]|nr:hypothetical protein GGI16_006277 [Coemansia sp. S142-1]